MRKLNRRLATQVIGRGRGPRRVVLLLTTIGRKSGQPRVTPLQYEEEQGVIYVASARGLMPIGSATFANPRVKVQIADRVFEGLAEPIVDPAHRRFPAVAPQTPSHPDEGMLALAGSGAAARRSERLSPQGATPFDRQKSVTRARTVPARAQGAHRGGAAA
jgi:deazaflavin-dependent oxidoreductase (nitroreductase family)